MSMPQPPSFQSCLDTSLGVERSKRIIHHFPFFVFSCLLLFLLQQCLFPSVTAKLKRLNGGVGHKTIFFGIFSSIMGVGIYGAKDQERRV